MASHAAKVLRAAQIRSLEQTLLHEYVIANGKRPAGNSK
jgi:hypothetical protein